MDDDITLNDSDVLHDMVQYANNENNISQIIGFTGTIFHPNQKETYQNGFHCSSNKFDWRNALSLPWQNGIVYEEIEKNSIHNQIKNQTTSSLNGVYKSKPWYSTPRWVWEQSKQDIELSSSSSAAAAAAASTTSTSTTSTSTTTSSNERKRKLSQSLSSSSSSSSSSSTPCNTTNKNNENQTGKVADLRIATSIKVDIIKGRMMFLHSVAMRSIPFAFNVNDIRGDDIAISGMVGKGQLGQHRVIRLLFNRIVELPAPFALCSTNGASHFQRRDDVRRRFFTSSSNVKNEEEEKEVKMKVKMKEELHVKKRPRN